MEAAGRKLCDAFLEFIALVGVIERIMATTCVVFLLQSVFNGESLADNGTFACFYIAFLHRP